MDLDSSNGESHNNGDNSNNGESHDNGGGRKPLTVEIRYAGLSWHTQLTKLYPVQREAITFWWPGGNLSEARERLETRPQDPPAATPRAANHVSACPIFAGNAKCHEMAVN
jgi:hypothetical protein